MNLSRIFINKTFKLSFILLSSIIFIIYFFIIFHYGSFSNYRDHISSNKSLHPDQLNVLLSEKEKVALIRQIVAESLKELTKNASIKLTNSQSTKSHNSVTINPYKLQRLFHYNYQKMNSDLPKRNSKLEPFQIQTSNDERAMMYHLLELFDKTLSKNNISYFMYGGTLLGSFRHHDLVPWDDDIDLMLSLEYHDKILDIFKSLEPDYILYRAGGHDKFYHKTGTKVPYYSWKWPYIDISYYEVNGSYIKDWTKTYGYWYYYPKEIVFPLHRRPLLNLSLPAPHDTFAFLTWTYNYGSPCLMYGYSHMVEGGGPAGNVGCETLSEKFPFVEHLPMKNHDSKKTGVREVLKYRDLVINDIIVDEPSYAIAETFKLSIKDGYKMPTHITPPTVT